MTPPDNGSSVQVAIRVRPMLAFEGGSTQCVEVLNNPDAGDCLNVIRIGGDKGPTFCFDQAFATTSTQQELYQHRVSPLVESCLQGYNATTLAYGQTGSGKTFSMTGPTSTMQDGNHAGIIPRAIQAIFDDLTKYKQERTNDESTYDFEVRIQFLELYGEEIRDLLTTRSNTEKLTIRDIGMEEPEVLGASQHKVDCAEEAMLCLTRGMLRRVTGSTAMNATSSRSHAIISLLLEQSTTASDGHASVVRSKFNFVDLAGSERQKRTLAEGQRLKESIDINKGLFVLGNVISALGDPKKAGKTFVPYRDSKLTRLLKGSLGGNHRTLMIACVSPSSNNLEESLNCLRYANRAKNIQNNAVVNVDAGTKLVAKLRDQVKALAVELLRIKQGGDLEDKTYSVELLQGLLQGEGDNKTPIKPRDSTRAVTPTTPYTGTPPVFSGIHQPERLQIAESQLEQTRHALQQTTKDLTSTTEDLFTVRAEKEMYRLRWETNGHVDVDTAFLAKATNYEREIATLKEAVQASVYYMSPDDHHSAAVIARASNSLQQEKAQLQPLQSELKPRTPTRYSSEYDDEDIEIDQLRSQFLQSVSMSPSTQLDAEEKAADEELSAIAKEFLEEDDNLDERTQDLNDDNATEDQDNFHQQVEVNLVDLSRSIDEKETLIQQLQQSQKKYASMRVFYEDKLKQMEEQVQERETEREALVVELQKLETSSPRAKEDPRTKELEQRLRDKERHISGLKKRQNELVNLTKVSSRNEAEINRLKNDIGTMKTNKVDLQKMINNERKSHVGEITRLKNDVMQHDCEANKWKRISDKKTAEVEKAHEVAKSRLEQIGTHKAKYTNAEKKLRVKTVKRGVMEKAGLDNVIVGRRTALKSPKQAATKPKIDVDSVRDFLDKKVADIGKKEATADKLAHEWEDRLELVSKKQELRNSRASKEAIQNVDVELKYKEERIRKLAERIGKQPSTGSEKDQEVFFDDEEFKELLPEASTLSGAKLTSRILFGMVVRERRHVASLARTASILNEQANEAQQTASEKDAAFRSYREEERAERTALAQNQQEQILSLMAMVQEDTIPASSTLSIDLDSPDKQFAYLSARMPNISPSTGFGSEGATSRMAVFAIERVEALERELRELRSERESMEMYKAMEADARNELSTKNARH